jgi:hypothetical protein
MSEVTNYPDVLGYITGGARVDYGVLQAAASVHPDPARAGTPIDVTVILQNASDAPLEVLVILNVPERDLTGMKGSFVAKVQRLAIGMQPCEVGVLKLPLLTQPGTAPGLYRLSMQVTAKATGKASRIRLPGGGGEFYMGGMNRHAQQMIEALRGLRFSGGQAAKRGLFGSSTPLLETHVTLQPGGLGKILDRQGDYQSLWLRRDLKEDPRVLLERHRESLTTHVLPSLDRTRLLEPLTKRTQVVFKQAGYELKPVEASLIARVMVRVLEYACTGQLSYGRKFMPRPEYEVAPLLEKPAASSAPHHLHWLADLLALLEDDDRAARFVSRFIPEKCYDGLLRDAFYYSLGEVEDALGLNFGDREELEKIAEEWMAKLDLASMTFADIYLPLVLAGAAIFDDVLLPDENVKELLEQLEGLREERADEYTEANAALFDMLRDIYDKSLRKYGLLTR